MPRTHQVTIPQVTIPVGTFTRTSPALPSDATQVQLILMQGADWTDDGQPVWTMALDYAADGQNFTQNLFTDPTTDSIVPAHFGHPAGQLSYGASLPDVGLGGRKIRFTLTATRARTVDSGTLDVL